MSLIILSSHSLLDRLYPYRAGLNCATWSFFPEHNFRWWAKLTSIFLIISFLLKPQAWFWVCAVPVVLMTFRFIILLTWCHRRWITSSWNLSTIVSWSSSILWALLGYQSKSWWEIPSLPLDELCYHRQVIAFPQHKLVRVMCYTLSSLLSNIWSSLPWSITIFYIKDVVLSTPGRRPYGYRFLFSKVIHSSMRKL